ncbi:MAG: hypothetical protein Q9182_007149 [Xanthomendoza sp. 2 TL-2023]
MQGRAQSEPMKGRGHFDPQPEGIPANTGLFFREDNSHNWLDMDRSMSCGWADSNSSNIQVVVDMSVSRSNILGTINYLQSSLSVISAANVASVYAKTIQEIISNPTRPVRDTQVLSVRDLEHLKLWNHDFPQKIDSCVHDLVLRYAESSPQAPAVCSWDGNLTYLELDDLSSVLARKFIDAGIRQETLVPVCFEKSLYAVVAMVAILRAGGAFVPLDPTHPKDRLEAIINKAGADVVVTSPGTAHIFRDISISIVEVSPGTMQCSNSPSDYPLPIVRSDHSAFVLFTSGSTGKPKGIIQEHASVCTSATAHGNAMHVTHTSRVFQYAAFTFDVSMMDIFTTLIHGGCVCIPSEQDRMGMFTTVMNSMRVNWVLFTPSVASLVKPEDVPTLETLVLGGEAVKQENVSRWVGKVRLFNCYGPAECGACAIGEFTRRDSRPANIGRQFGGELCWVVDPENHNRLLPIGAVGELVVEGPTLARGYLDDLTKTQAVFIKSPDWPRATGHQRPRRIYKTGDLVRQNSDGSFDFVGRKDLQVKVRGQRVEIGEVEHHISTYPGIALSMVARPQTGAYAQTLIGVIQLTNGPQVCYDELNYLSSKHLLAAKFDRGKLLQYLTSKLPGYMVPTHVLVINKLPLSVSGKIDRKIVDAWLVRTSRPTETVEKSLLPKDDAIALDLCSKVLSMVSKADSAFFKSLDGTDFMLAGVGLDSIKVIHLIMFIRQRFGVKIHLDVLMNPKSSIRTVADTIVLQTRSRKIAVKPEVDIMETFQAYKHTALKGVKGQRTMFMNVFLTGSTGFLGSRILRQLCRDPMVHRVLAHVRSQNSQKGLQRIVESAKRAGWWTDDCVHKLEAWTGDLAKPKLGLSTEQWKRVCGQGSPQEQVTAIIHNGATVNWNSPLVALKGANVDSTTDLLRAASESSSLTQFVFVSGGQLPQVEDNEDDAIIAKEIGRSSGYAQSKFLSELMIKEYARVLASGRQRISIVKPGYIIGSKEDGMAPVDDFIWRLTASCAALQTYSGEENGSWLFISDVNRVASTVLDCCCQPEQVQVPSSQGFETVKVLDGLPVSEFWNIVKQRLGIEMHPSSGSSWVNRLYSSIDVQGEKHPLWPLLQTIDQGQGKLGRVCNSPEMTDDNMQRVREAIAKNIDYLVHVGFLSRFRQTNMVPKDKKGENFVGKPCAIAA